MDFTIVSQDFRSKRSNVDDRFEFSMEGQVCFMVTIEDDMFLEFDESFTLQLNEGSFSPAGVNAGAQDSTEITILDDQGIIIIYRVREDWVGFACYQWLMV